MELLLICHAMVEPAKGEGEGADDARPLSPKEIRRFRKVVKGLEGLGLTLDLLLTSPKRRAGGWAWWGMNPAFPPSFPGSS